MHKNLSGKRLDNVSLEELDIVVRSFLFRCLSQFNPLSSGSVITKPSIFLVCAVRVPGV